MGFVAAGPVSRILQTRLQTRKLWDGNCESTSMRSILALLTGCASHLCHKNFSPFAKIITSAQEQKRMGQPKGVWGKATNGFYQIETN
jgi:hypothetical protein